MRDDVANALGVLSDWMHVGNTFACGGMEHVSGLVFLPLVLTYHMFEDLYATRDGHNLGVRRFLKQEQRCGTTVKQASDPISCAAALMR